MDFVTVVDQAIALLRAYWGEPRVDFTGRHYHATAMSMEPKPPQGRAARIRRGAEQEERPLPGERIAERLNQAHAWLLSRIECLGDGR